MIGAAGSHELIVSPTLGHAPFIHQQNQVCTADGGEAMGDHERGSPGQQRSHRCLNELLALGVQVAGGLVEDEDLG